MDNGPGPAGHPVGVQQHRRGMGEAWHARAPALLAYSVGSLGELASLLRFARDRGFLEEKVWLALSGSCETCPKLSLVACSRQSDPGTVGPDSWFPFSRFPTRPVLPVLPVPPASIPFACAYIRLREYGPFLCDRAAADRRRADPAPDPELPGRRAALRLRPPGGARPARSRRSPATSRCCAGPSWSGTRRSRSSCSTGCAGTSSRTGRLLSAMLDARGATTMRLMRGRARPGRRPEPLAHPRQDAWSAG